MFDIGASELFLIAVVALVVLGPERLPKAARFAGLWIRRARAQWYSVRSELERELAAEELQRSLRESRETVRDIEADIRATDADMRREFEAMRKDVRRMDTDDEAPAGAPAERGLGLGSAEDAMQPLAPPAAATAAATATDPQGTADVGR
jgi:sec-independent protein translocase protein TatB